MPSLPGPKRAWSFSNTSICWPRTLPGDFGEVVAHLGAGGGVITLDDARLQSLSVSAAGRVALDLLLEDQRLLRAHDRDPVLNCIHGYPRDQDAEPVRTDVFSFHAGLQPIEQPLAEFVLELLDLLAERGLRDAALLGGAREIAGAGDGHGVAKLVHLHREWQSFR